MQLQQSSARVTARSLRLAVHDAQIHDNSKALEIWERELNVVKHYREQLQEEGGAKALCQVIKTGADSRHLCGKIWSERQVHRAQSCAGRHVLLLHDLP